MEISVANLDALRVGFKTNFQAGLGEANADDELICETVPSSNASETYGWLGEFDEMKEWLGDRVVRNMAEHDYTIRNKDWELTIGVDRNKIMDDSLGIYAKRFVGMGRSVRAHKPRTSWGLLKAGFATLCYDGQYYFDTDHPVIAANGNVASVANTDGGAGRPWFLMDSRMLLKPVLFQERKAPAFVSKDQLTDDNVFLKKQFLYGVDSRDNVGFGFWQGIWGSKQTLNAANYAAARAALTNMTGDYGRPLGIVPDTLIVMGQDESAGRKIVNSDNASGGETNEWKGTARLVVSPWLAAA